LALADQNQRYKHDKRRAPKGGIEKRIGFAHAFFSRRFSSRSTALRIRSARFSLISLSKTASILARVPAGNLCDEKD
jgi:hypothetical protein